MASVTTPIQPIASPVSNQSVIPPLEEGDHLDQKTFHARYQAMAESVRAELIGGVVYMPSPLKRPHGKLHMKLIHWLAEYEDSTPGTEGFDNTSYVLGPISEPQPDVSLLISNPAIGQTRDENGYIVGAPELVAEVASSTEAIDFHAKKRDYESASVGEYLIVAIRQGLVFWFIRRGNQFVELLPGPDGIYRSEIFPGLWLDPVALLKADGPKVTQTLRLGLATPEHAAFVARLAEKVT